MKKTLLTLALVLAAGGAQAVPMSGLLTGGSITQGDKLFDNFSIIDYDASLAGRTFNPANIEVVGIGDGVTTDYGLRFTVNSGELSVIGDDFYAFVDLMFGFRASVTAPGMAINGASSDLGAFLSWMVDQDNDSGSFILEKVGTVAGLDDLGEMEVEFSLLDDVQTSVISDTAAFLPQNEVWVTKNILVWAADSTDSAGVLSFEQRFSQTAIPEPATLALFGLGLLGLGFARRRA